MNVNSLKNNTAFSANYKFVSAPTVKEQLAKGITVSPKVNWENSHEKISRALPAPEYIVSEARRGLQIGTEDILMCNAGCITGGKTQNNLCFHLEPQIFMENLKDNLVELQEKFRETVSLLRAEKKKPEGLIYGGDVNSPECKDHLVVLAGSMKKSGITPAVIWGTGDNGEISNHVKSMFYDGNTNTHYLNVHTPVSDDFSSKSNALDSFQYRRILLHDYMKFSDTNWNPGGKEWNKGALNTPYARILAKYGVESK
jgi:hypothetical protein